MLPKRAIVALSLCALLFPLTLSAATASATVTVCGTVDQYTSATINSAGLLLLDGIPYTLAAGSTINDTTLIRTGASICLTGQLSAGIFSGPLTVSANAQSHVHICGVVSSFTAATAAIPGSISIGGTTLPIAINTTITNSDLIRVGADLCLDATVNAAGQITLPSSVTLAASSTVDVCGTLNAYVAATATQNGSITIDGRSLTIATGTSLDGIAQVTLGTRVCLHGTLNAAGQLIPPASVRADGSASGSIDVCGTVSAFVAATANATGSITVGSQSIVLSPGLTLTNQNLIRAGTNLCIRGTLNASGALVPPATVILNATSSIHVCGRVQAYVAATSVSSGNITIGGQTFAIASGTTVHGSIQVGTTLCIDGSITPPDIIIGVTVTPPTGNPPGGNPPGPGVPPFPTDHSCDNHVPVIAVPSSVMVQLGRTVKFQVIASDADGDAVTLSSCSLPPGATLDPTGTFTFTPANECPNPASTQVPVTFVATDSRGASTTTTVTIGIVGDGHGGANPPLISVPTGTISVVAGQTVTLPIGAVSQASSCAPSLQALGSADALVNGSSLIYTAPSSSAGATAMVRLQAADCEGLRANASVRILVVDGNMATAHGQLGLTASNITFNDLGVNGYVDLPITNTGNGMLTIRSVALVRNNGPFRLDGMVALPILLPSGATFNVRVTFDPLLGGSLNDVVRIETDDAIRPVVEVGIGRGHGRDLKH